jgi:release factor glutamine methyltransferase
MSPTAGELVAAARRRLRDAPFNPPGREALLLMGHALGLAEAAVLAHPERRLSAAEAARFEELLARRLTGEPVAYLTGEREFWGRRFAVDRRVLIPRPETEHLVEAALGLALPPAPRVLDLGTGSGCLAVTLAAALPAARVTAPDRSPAALAVAAANARRHRVAERVAFAAADLFAGLDAAGFDLVVSNPPYVDPADAPRLSPEVRRFEPHSALFAPGRGDAVLENLIHDAARRAPRATLLLEIGDGQLAAVRSHAERAGLVAEAEIADYAGTPRVVRLAPPGGGRPR